MDCKINTLFNNNEVIATIKDDHSFKAAIQSKCKIIFVLYGNILNITQILQTLIQANKTVFVDVDLIEGFSSRDIVIQFLKEQSKITGILSSKAYMIKAAKAAGFLTIHRFFLIDSFSYHSLDKQIKISKPDFIEILPGCMPKVIGWVKSKITIPIIAGGLICEKDDAAAALQAGATAVSTTNSELWLF